MEREQNKPNRKEDLLKHTPLLRYFLSEEFKFNPNDWEPSAAQKIITMYQEIQTFKGAEWDHALISGVTNLWTMRDYAHPQVPKNSLKLTIGTLLMSGYEIGNTEDLQELKPDVMQKMKDLQLFYPPELPIEEYIVAEDIITSTMQTGVDYRKEINAIKMHNTQRQMATNNSDFGVFREFILKDLNLDNL